MLTKLSLERFKNESEVNKRKRIYPLFISAY